MQRDARQRSWSRGGQEQTRVQRVRDSFSRHRNDETWSRFHERFINFGNEWVTPAPVQLPCLHLDPSMDSLWCMRSSRRAWEPRPRILRASSPPSEASSFDRLKKFHPTDLGRLTPPRSASSTV